MLTKAQICNLLERNDKAIARALVVLNDNQTVNEQRSESTIIRNGEGFRPCHARMGTSMARFFIRNGYLSPKQLAYWRVKDKNGDMRLGIYWRQLAEAAEAKAASKVAQPVVEDVGNAAEAEMVQREIDSTSNVHPDEAEMHRMEAEGDRQQTIKEEFLKNLRRSQMERGVYYPKYSNTRI